MGISFFLMVCGVVTTDNTILVTLMGKQKAFGLPIRFAGELIDMFLGCAYDILELGSGTTLAILRLAVVESRHGWPAQSAVDNIHLFGW